MTAFILRRGRRRRSAPVSRARATSLRVREWSLEGAESQDCLILTLVTGDGFEVSLRTPFDVGGRSGATLFDESERAIETARSTDLSRPDQEDFMQSEIATAVDAKPISDLVNAAYQGAEGRSMGGPTRWS